VKSTVDDHERVVASRRAVLRRALDLSSRRPHRTMPARCAATGGERERGSRCRSVGRSGERRRIDFWTDLPTDRPTNRCRSMHRGIRPSVAAVVVLAAETIRERIHRSFRRSARRSRHRRTNERACGLPLAILATTKPRSTDRPIDRQTDRRRKKKVGACVRVCRVHLAKRVVRFGSVRFGSVRTDRSIVQQRTDRLAVGGWILSISARDRSFVRSPTTAFLSPPPLLLLLALLLLPLRRRRRRRRRRRW